MNKTLILFIGMFSLKHQTLISTLYGHLQRCGLDYQGIYIIAIINEKLIVNKISQRDEKGEIKEAELLLN